MFNKNTLTMEGSENSDMPSFYPRLAALLESEVTCYMTAAGAQPTSICINLFKQHARITANH
jgi:hypothetical protein